MYILYNIYDIHYHDTIIITYYVNITIIIVDIINK